MEQELAEKNETRLRNEEYGLKEIYKKYEKFRRNGNLCIIGAIILGYIECQTIVDAISIGRFDTAVVGLIILIALVMGFKKNKESENRLFDGFFKGKEKQFPK